MSTALWRDAGDPRGAHALCEAVSSARRYAHSRGVAQQAARAARAMALDPDARRHLLTAAWLHDIGYALPGSSHALDGARALRRAGHEDVARMVAHHSNAAARAQAAGLAPIGGEFPRPAGRDAALLALLDVADLLTGPDGERVDPAGRLAGLVNRRGPRSPSVRALVDNVNRLGADPTTRSLIEQMSVPGVAA